MLHWINNSYITASINPYNDDNEPQFTKQLWQSKSVEFSILTDIDIYLVHCVVTLQAFTLSCQPCGILTFVIFNRIHCAFVWLVCCSWALCTVILNRSSRLSATPSVMTDWRTTCQALIRTASKCPVTKWNTTRSRQVNRGGVVAEENSYSAVQMRLILWQSNTE